MKKLFSFLFLFLIIALLYLLLWPVPFDPVAFTPPPDPGLKGAFAKNEKLGAAQLFLEGRGVGPEAIVVGNDGTLYTGYENGDVINFSSDGQFIRKFTNTGGRPLGMKLDADGNLVVADQVKGLLSINPAGEVSVLTDKVNGKKIPFPDDLDIASDGMIYFSDASQRSNTNTILEAWELNPTGRLLSYDPNTKATKVELEKLYFANGVAVGPNDDYLLFTETFGHVINKYWLKGAKKGQKEIWVNELPGFPDNITYNDNGIFWLAIPTIRIGEAFEKLHAKPFLKKIIYRLPIFITGAEEAPPFGMLVGFDENGQVTHNYQDSKGKTHMVTSVLEHEEHLYLGSLKMEAISKMKK